MKCAYHPESEAIETCANCYMPVCSACGIPIGNKTYCDDCLDEIFARHTAKPGGILGVIAGVIALFWGVWLTVMALIPEGGDDEWLFGKRIQMGAGPDWAQAGCGIALIVLSLLAIIGSRCAMDREHYKLAVVGGVCATLCMPVLGIPALILIVFSRDEFDQPYVNSCQKESTCLLNRLHW